MVRNTVPRNMLDFELSICPPNPAYMTSMCLTKGTKATFDNKLLFTKLSDPTVTQSRYNES